MSLQKINIRTIVLILMMVVVAAFRLLSYKFPYILSNFTPVGAIALFGGTYFTQKWKAYLVVLTTLFTSDVIINYLYTSKWVLYYEGSIWVYLTFALMVFIGGMIKNTTAINVFIASLSSVVLHWLIIDLPWLYGTLYAHNLSGYAKSLIAAIPFEQNMVYGDILFCTLLYGGFELAQKRFNALRVQHKLAV